MMSGFAPASGTILAAFSGPPLGSNPGALSEHHMQKQPTAPADPEHETFVCDIDVLNALLRGEVAAVETYDLVIPKFDGHPQAVELEHIRSEHADAAEVLRDRVRHFGGEPAETSGAWGKFTAAVTGAAKILGPAVALGALKQGEEHGINHYESAAADPDIATADRELIRARLLPRCRGHVAVLEGMIAAVKR